MNGQARHHGSLDPVLRRLAEEIADFEASVDELPVAPAVTATQIRERLSAFVVSNLPRRKNFALGLSASRLIPWSR